MVRLHEQFEWEVSKAASNLAKHAVSFDEAALALEDPDGDRFHVDFDDPSHSEGEDRSVTFASLPEDRGKLLVICWTDRSTDEEQVTRIIGARKASRRETERHARELGNESGPSQGGGNS